MRDQLIVKYDSKEELPWEVFVLVLQGLVHRVDIVAKFTHIPFEPVKPHFQEVERFFVVYQLSLFLIQQLKSKKEEFDLGDEHCTLRFTVKQIVEERYQVEVSSEVREHLLKWVDSSNWGRSFAEHVTFHTCLLSRGQGAIAQRKLGRGEGSCICFGAKCRTKKSRLA